MEHALWIVIALRRLPSRRPRGAGYTNRQILAVLLWAALRDRPIDWACKRRHWPPQAWRRVLPSQLACPPNPDPCAMRVPRGHGLAQETLDEADEAHTGADHHEAA